MLVGSLTPVTKASLICLLPWQDHRELSFLCHLLVFNALNGVLPKKKKEDKNKKKTDNNGEYFYLKIINLTSNNYRTKI